MKLTSLMGPAIAASLLAGAVPIAERSIIPQPIRIGRDHKLSKRQQRKRSNKLRLHAEKVSQSKLTRAKNLASSFLGLPKRDEPRTYNEAINRMTNWQRNQWIRNGGVMDADIMNEFAAKPHWKQSADYLASIHA